MANLVQIGPRQQVASGLGCSIPQRTTAIVWLQIVTLAWMLVECSVSVYAALAARSPALLAFGADSVVELLSASVVLLQFLPGFSIPEQKAARTNGVLLFALAAVVAACALDSLISNRPPETCYTGIGITIAALIAMPVLAGLKRREARRTNNTALAADAVQSATCAYLALLTLIGLAIHALFHVAWVDPVAALIAIPVMVKEGRSAWQGQACGCC